MEVLKGSAGNRRRVRCFLGQICSPHDFPRSLPTAARGVSGPAVGAFCGF